MENEIRILGAGLSGLTAAINLAKAGKNVRVFEKRRAVGEQIFPNLQGLIKTEPCDSVEGYFRLLGIRPGKFVHFEISRFRFLTRSRSMKLHAEKGYPFVLRGGKGSLERALFEEAMSLGVKFEFNSTAAEREVHIVSSGPKRADAAAFGAVYEGRSWLGKDELLIMYDDRYSPKGWYIYAQSCLGGRTEIVNCCQQPYAPLVKKLFFKAISERRELKELVGGRKPIATFGGFCNIGIPGSAIIDGRLYTGEAAGFQDSFRGFGMNYALLSGKLAADSIIHGSDYDTLWRKELMPKMKLDFARRFVMSILGDRVPELAMRKYSDGDEVDFDRFVPSNRFWYCLLVDILCGAEMLKKRATGYW